MYLGFLCTGDIKRRRKVALLFGFFIVGKRKRVWGGI